MRPLKHRKVSLCSLNQLEYGSWKCMIDRCYNPKNVSYPRYGGKGIKVCDEWKNSFKEFISDMGNRPSKTHSIDRFPDKFGNYEPSNCRWATKKQQSRNAINNAFILYRGFKLCVSEWSEVLKVPSGTIFNRRAKGLSDEECLFGEGKKGNITVSQLLLKRFRNG